MATVSLMSAEQLLALPADGMDRELIHGELRERPMTLRNRIDSAVEARVVSELVRWLDHQDEPRGRIVSGEAGFRLRRNPDTAVGIDVAYVSAEQANPVMASTSLFEGPPVLAVEILSPSDSQEAIEEKVFLYLECGVSVVWVIQPRFRTVTIHAAGEEPRMVSVSQELTAEPHLPGFRVAVARPFE